MRLERPGFSRRLARPYSLAALCLVVLLEPLPAQNLTQPPGRAIEAWEIAAVAGVSALSVFVFDKPIREFAQTNQSNPATHLANAFRQLGEVEVFAPGAVGVLVYGLVADDRETERTGKRLIAAEVLDLALTFGVKVALGRERPNVSGDHLRFTPFSITNRSLPSGHTSTAFAFVTTLADDFNRSGLTIVLYAAATGTAFSRIYDDRHWLSDTIAGAAIGIASAKLVSGRWTLFGMDTPGWLAADQDGDRTDVLDVALGIAGGVLLGQVAESALNRYRVAAPQILSAPIEGWGIGWRLAF
jgi:membrane-associated phospholipid phosphatase